MILILLYFIFMISIGAHTFILTFPSFSLPSFPPQFLIHNLLVLRSSQVPPFLLHHPSPLLLPPPYTHLHLSVSLNHLVSFPSLSLPSSSRRLKSHSSNNLTSSPLSLFSVFSLPFSLLLLPHFSTTNFYSLPVYLG